MKFAALSSVFLLLWAILGLILLTLWHDWQARRGGRVTITKLQVFLGGPILWFFELLTFFQDRPRHLGDHRRRF